MDVGINAARTSLADNRDSFVIVRDLFAIPHGDLFIIFVPLKGIILSVNQSFVKKLTLYADNLSRLQNEDIVFFEELLALGLIEKSSQKDMASSSNEEAASQDALSPSHVIILASDHCNLACKYCYASPGAKRVKKFDTTMAKAAIRFIIDNALNHDKDVCDMAFHGGGEPTLDFQLLRICVEYANQYSQQRSNGKIRVAPSIVTNGFINNEQVNWLAANMDSIQVSFDGLQEIQNDQRPQINGRPTFEHVFSVIQKIITQQPPHILIKSTITNQHVHQMGDIARFLCENISLERFHFGPALNFGRSLETGYCEPNPEEFVARAVEAQNIAAQYGKKVVVSMAQETFPNVRNSFCGLTSPNFAITLEGNITACFEVLNHHDARAKLFYYGTYDKQKKYFIFDKEKINAITSRTVKGLTRCQNCYAKWQCAGDCQARWYNSDTGEESPTKPDFRCSVNRELVKQEILKRLSQSNTVRPYEHKFVSGDGTCN